MSRRPRAPLALRPLAGAPTTAVPVELDAPGTRTLPAPPVQTREAQIAPELRSLPFALAPEAPTATLPLDDGAVTIVELDVRPAVDTAPESLRTQVFALRTASTQLPRVEPSARVTLPQTHIETVRPPGTPAVKRGLPAAAFTRSAAPRPPAELSPNVLRRCLEALFRSSGASSTADLRLVGIYPRVPVGAIGGVSLGENGAVNLRLREAGPAARGMLVVGRRVSTGDLATCEVGEDGHTPPTPLRRRGRHR